MPRKALPLKLNENDFSDRIVYEKAEEIITNYLSVSDAGDKAKRNYERKMIKKITNAFSSIVLKDLNSDSEAQYLISVLEKKSSIECFYIIRMIYLLLDNGLITNSAYIKLIPFRNRFFFHYKFEEVKEVLTGKSYGFLVSENKALTEEECKLFFIQFPLVSFKSSSMKHYAERFFFDLKCEEKYTLKVRMQRVYSFQFYLKNVFADLEPLDINLMHIQKCCDNDSIDNRKGNLAVLLDFLLYLQDATTLAEEILQFLGYKEYLYSRLVTQSFVKLCTAKYIDRYVMRDTKEWKKSGVYQIFYINIPKDSELFSVMADFVRSVSYDSSSFHIFLNEFWESLGPNEVMHIEDLSLSIFKNCIQWFGRYEDKKYSTYIFAFFNICYNLTQVNFFERDGINAELLHKPGIANRIMEGYEIIIYNPMEDTPQNDRWILHYNPNFETTAFDKSSNTVYVDFLQIQNIEYRQWCKEYVWKARCGLRTKLARIPCFIYFFNYIQKLRSGEVYSVFCPKPSVNTEFLKTEINAYLNQLKMDKNAGKTIDTHIYNIQALLHFVNAAKIAEIPSTTFYLLYKHNSKVENTARPIPEEHLVKLIEVLSENAKLSLEYEVYFEIFHIAIKTHFRISRIVNFSIYDIKPAFKNNQFVLVSKTKVSFGEKQEFPIPIEVKRGIDHVMKITESIRCKCTQNNLYEYLFIVPLLGSRICRKITVQDFRVYLKKCCEEVGIPKYGPENLRDTYMNNVIEFTINEKLSNVERNSLTLHKNISVDEKSYRNIPIKELLESFYGAIIGDINVSGNVVEKLPENIEKPENEVSNGCGYCRSEYCKNLTYLDCMLCKDFVTTPKQLKYFEEQIAIMDEKIKFAEIPHDKEDYVNIKRLLLGYVYKIMEKMEDVHVDK